MSVQETLVTRRQFIKYSALGLTAMAVGSGTSFSLLPRTGAHAQTTAINLGMTTAEVEMVDSVMVPHWVYTVDGRPTLPGPVIFAYENEEIQINVTNNIPGITRRFAIVGNDFAGNQFSLIQQSGEIPYGGTGSLTIAAGSLAPGTYLYKDPTLDPISRVLGLHGVLVILPNPAVTQINPYGAFSTPNVGALFAALGVGTPRHPEAIFPGQSWFATTDANPAGYQPHHNDSDHHHYKHFIEAPTGPRSPVFERFFYRSRIWLHSSIDPELNRKIIYQGNIPDPATVRENFLPQYFSINGRQGAFAMHSPDIFPRGTVGEPHFIRLLNAGLAYHSPHQHGNHAYITAVNNVVGGGGIYFGNAAGADNVFFVDTITLGPEERVDWVLPFIRPPDIPRVVGNDGLLVPLAQLIPQELDTVLITPQNPLGYPMHSHLELDQTAAGGNYPQGTVTGWEISGEFGANFKTPVISGPVASHDSATTSGTAPVTINVLANDTLNGQPIMAHEATVALVTPAGRGIVVLNADKSFTYTANADFTGTDSFTYTVTVNGQVSNPATVTVMVAAVVQPPIANNDNANTSGTAPVTINVLANDTLNGQPIMAHEATVMLVTPAGRGIAVLNADKSFTYTANADFAGTDSFTYTVTVNGQVSNPATVTVMVAAVAPTVKLTIDRFRATKSVRVARKQRVELELRVRNSGTVEGSAPATVVGIQNGIQIYTQTLAVSDRKGGGATNFALASYTPIVAGNITWTVTLQGVMATATTEVR